MSNTVKQAMAECHCEPPRGEKSNALSLGQQLTYALPVLGTIFLFGPIAIVQGIYAKYFGLSLAVIASLVLATRLLDALTDPLIGYLSDRAQAHTGTRKVFIAIGAVLFLVSAYYLFVPVDPASINKDTTVSGTYFFIAFFFFYLGLTLFDIPHLSWGAELTFSA
ncbi:MFS transporter, partial [Porticoccaceae bacterium]|nr:MFS transporter [Porticoccaceae bacterium]